MAPREKDSRSYHDEPRKSSSELNIDKQTPPLLAACQHVLKPNGSIIGREVAEAILPQFRTFCSAIPASVPPQGDRPAIASIDGRQAITHRRVYEFCVNEFGQVLHALGFGRGDRIALVLPNGPELALAIVATAHWSSCVPLSANSAPSELESDLMRCGADLVIGPYSGPIADSNGTADFWSAFRGIEDSAVKLNIPFVGMVPSPREAGVFRLQPSRTILPLDFDQVKPLTNIRQKHEQLSCNKPNAASDEVLVLFTSGTTGNKKLVPHQLDAMLVAAATISLSWALEPDDTSCCMMPLYHIG
jgi:acyl-coenzyme A synthetase/AMP-(fatty) acid ligase